MTAMTSAAGASTTIDWVDWSAMGSRLAVSAVWRAGALTLCYSRVAIPARFDTTSLTGAAGDGAPDGGEERTRRARVQRSCDHRGGSGRGLDGHARDQCR